MEDAHLEVVAPGRPLRRKHSEGNQMEGKDEKISGAGVSFLFSTSCFVSGEAVGVVLAVDCLRDWGLLHQKRQPRFLRKEGLPRQKRVQVVVSDSNGEWR